MDGNASIFSILKVSLQLYLGYNLYARCYKKIGLGINLQILYTMLNEKSRIIFFVMAF